jgi:hypothetical protein
MAERGIDLESRVRRREGMPWRQLDDVVMVLDVESGDFFELDEVGGRIWLGLDGEHTLDEQARALADAYAIELDRARGDVLEFVTELCSRRLVSRVD